MCANYGVFDWIVFVLVVVGGLNWGLVGFFDYNFVASVFGDGSMFTRIIYAAVGLAALYQVFCCFRSRS